jgi:hypothetical protein
MQLERLVPENRRSLNILTALLLLDILDDMAHGFLRGCANSIRRVISSTSRSNAQDAPEKARFVAGIFKRSAGRSKRTTGLVGNPIDESEHTLKELSIRSEDRTAMNLGNLLAGSAERNPRKTAIFLENESISYEQLDHSTTYLARWFLGQGCKPGDRIAVHWPNSIETAKLFFACFKAGIIAVPVNVRMKAPEVAYVLQHSQAAMYFAHPGLARVAEEVRKGGALGCVQYIAH